MRLWPRRKVIYTWDDNFAPSLDYVPGPIISQRFTWYCPDDAYIRLTSIYGFYQATPGIRPGETMQFSIHRGHITRYRVDLMLGVAAVGEKPFCIYASAFRYTSAASGLIRSNALPDPCHLIPGESIRIQHGVALPADNYHDMAISYDRWELA